MRTIRLSRELKTGIITVVTLVAFVWGFNYLKGKDLFNKHRTFYVIYNNVSGLMDANSVTVSGLPIGQVDKIYFHKNDPKKVIVELTISNNINIPTNSTARIYSSDLLGSKSIEIILGNATTYAMSGDTLKSDYAMSLQEEVSDMVQPVLKKASSMMTSIDSVITAVGDIFNYRTRENLIRSVESLRATIGNIESSTHSIDTLITTQRTRLSRIFANVESITYNLRQNNDELSRIISNAALISDTIARADVAGTLANLQRTMENLALATDKINKGEGSIGLLVNDDRLYNDLERSSLELGNLLRDIRLNPKRYVHFSIFGGSSKRIDNATDATGN